VLFILSNYQINHEQLDTLIAERRRLGDTVPKQDTNGNNIDKPDDPDTFNFTSDVIYCETEMEICCGFLDKLASYESVLLYGFNSSSTSRENSVDEITGKVTKYASIGYDLPFIIARSNLYTKTEVIMGAKLFNQTGR